jgi:hypothetical protein
MTNSSTSRDGNGYALTKFFANVDFSAEAMVLWPELRRSNADHGARKYDKIPVRSGACFYMNHHKTWRSRFVEFHSRFNRVSIN